MKPVDRIPHPERIPAVFAWKTRVATVDVGPDRLLTPTAQLKYQQEAGELHFEQGNLGFEGIAAVGMAFVAVQNNAVIYRRPAVSEAITVKTWSHSVRGAKFYRCYRFESEDGELLIDSMAIFVLVDVNEHTLLRSSQFPFEIIHAPDQPHTCPIPSRLRMPDTAAPCGEHTVTFSQLDFNGHLNNTRYADIVFDHVPAEMVSRMDGFSIAFLHEAKCGDVLMLTKAVGEDGKEILLHAKNSDSACFTAQIRVK